MEQVKESQSKIWKKILPILVLLFLLAVYLKESSSGYPRFTLISFVFYAYAFASSIVLWILLKVFKEKVSAKKVFYSIFLSTLITFLVLATVYYLIELTQVHIEVSLKTFYTSIILFIFVIFSTISLLTTFFLRNQIQFSWKNSLIIVASLTAPILAFLSITLVVS